MEIDKKIQELREEIEKFENNEENYFYECEKCNVSNNYQFYCDECKSSENMVKRLIEYGTYDTLKAKLSAYEEAKKLMNEKVKETYYSVENKWFKECQRIDNELTNKINELKKQNKNLRDKVSRFESGLTPNEKYKYKKLKEEMKLTNEAYNDVCDERDNLRKKAEELRKEIESWKETCKIVGDEKLMESIQKSLDEISKGKGIPLEQL